MPFATNALDAVHTYFEDGGRGGSPVVFSGGLFDSIAALRDSPIAETLEAAGLRVIYADHRGLGRSDRPHDPAAYAIDLRAADVVAVLDALELDQAAFVGSSWGARLGFGAGARYPERLGPLVLGGQQPYAMHPDGPIVRTVTGGLEAARSEGMEALVRAMEAFSGSPFPDLQRRRWLDNDPHAIHAAWSAALGEGAVAEHLEAWSAFVLVYAGEHDRDFHDQARQAAEEIPGAEFISVPGVDHLGAHGHPDAVLPAILRTLRP